MVIPNADHIKSRFVASERLEQKSLDARVGGLREGWEMFLRQPFFGTGPNAELFLLAHRLPKGSTVEPLEPPHNAFLLALVNFGIVGMILLFMILLTVRSLGYAHTRGGRDKPAPTSYSLLACMVILAIFDHYLLSAWSGQALVAAAFCISDTS